MRDSTFYAYLSITGVSCLIGLITITLSCKIKAYQNYSYELMMFIVFSEILYSASRFFSIKTNTASPPTTLDPLREGLAFTQLFFSIFSDTFTLLSGIVLSIKICDDIIKCFNLFVKKTMRNVCRLFIILGTIITATVILVLQNNKVNNDTCQNKYQCIPCQLISCHFDNILNEALIYFFTTLSLIQVIFFIISISFICKVLKTTNGHSTEIKAKMRTILMLLMSYPLIAFLLWMIRLLPVIIGYTEVKNHFYLIPTSLRCSIYSISLLVNIPELRYVFPCSKKHMCVMMNELSLSSNGSEIL